MTRHVPLLVRARLAAGIAWAAPWGISLDGLLAAEITGTRERAGEDADVPPDLPLPLARCADAGTGPADWHWAATSAFPEGLAATLPDVRYWTARLDERASEQVTERLPVRIPARQGRYRARRMPLLVTVCDAVTWHAHGDPDTIRAILCGVMAIGKKRSCGEGQVLAWEVTSAPLSPWQAAHLYPDGTLGRPCPPRCLDGHPDVATGGRGTAGLRPPYMHPSRQQDLLLPSTAA